MIEIDPHQVLDRLLEESPNIKQAAIKVVRDQLDRAMGITSISEPLKWTSWAPALVEEAAVQKDVNELWKALVTRVIQEVRESIEFKSAERIGSGQSPDVISC